MKQNLFIKYLILLFISQLFVGCEFYPLIQKSYFANPPNAAYFQYEKEKNIKFSGNFSHAQIQSNIILFKHFGLSAGLMGGFYKHGADIGGVYFTNFSPSGYFELQGGAGFYQDKTSWVKTLAATGASYQVWFDYTIDSKYRKMYAQPSYFFKVNQDIKLGLTLKANYVYFSKYFYEYSRAEYQDQMQISAPYDYGKADTKNISCFVYEPTLTIQQVKDMKRYFIQLSYVYSTNAFTTSASSWGQEYQSNHPQHADFVIAAGIEFKFGKPKE
ncbi:MAG TPA: hypothetical protein PKK00_07095 [Bacteroidales bacterium]|nr:hypothetical protein [Bacteroidales bacterium]HPS17098.1 hypothetical protein [Bacteroidales bacterium]